MNEAQSLESSRKSRRFPDEFKRDAVRLVTDEKYTFKAAAQAVGVSVKSLYDWHKKFAPPPEPCGEDATVTELQAEVKQLRKSLKRAELEREILKKATAAIFVNRRGAKESQCPFTGKLTPGYKNIATLFPWL